MDTWILEKKQAPDELQASAEPRELEQQEPEPETETVQVGYKQVAYLNGVYEGEYHGGEQSAGRTCCACGQRRCWRCHPNGRTC